MIPSPPSSFIGSLPSANPSALPPFFVPFSSILTILAGNPEAPPSFPSFFPTDVTPFFFFHSVTFFIFGPPSLVIVPSVVSPLFPDDIFPSLLTICFHSLPVLFVNLEFQQDLDFLFTTYPASHYGIQTVSPPCFFTIRTFSLLTPDLPNSSLLHTSCCRRS